MKLSLALLSVLAPISVSCQELRAGVHSRSLGQDKKGKGRKGMNEKEGGKEEETNGKKGNGKNSDDDDDDDDNDDNGSGFAACNKDGSSRFPFLGADNSERLLLREGVIDAIPKSLCGNKDGKNVILVVGDGMGWEMVRAGAVARQILAELDGMGIDTQNGSPDTPEAEAAMKAFKGRTLSDYYTRGHGSGLSFQDELEDFALMTTTTTVIQKPNPGNHYAPANSLLEGGVADHDDGMAPLALNECGYPIDFSPLDYELEGGNMVLWNDKIGGKVPWDKRYYGAEHYGKFDPEYILQHVADSASTAATMATGHKSAVNMMSVNLYEEDVSTIVEDAMMCGKAGGVITSVPVLHATPGAFVTHSNNRRNGAQLQASFMDVNPTLTAGACAGSTQPSEEMKKAMMDGGSLSSQWTFLYQGKDGSTAENFYDAAKELDPDNGDHLMVCFGGEYSKGQSNLPYRGLDSGYSNRWCSNAEEVTDIDDKLTGYVATSERCDHYTAEEVTQIPKMADNVKEAINFLGKDDDGFFMMYEQGDIDWAAHANHMDDMLGAMLDISDGVQEIIDWVKANGGWKKNSLYVTADHDHYLTLHDDFPELVAKHIILGETHNMTPRNNSNKNPWSAAVTAGRHEDDSKSQTDHIADFATWTEQDIENVGHFWGAAGSGGNGWGSHSTRPVGLWYMGDDHCIESLTGTGYRVLGREVPGLDGKIDQMHLHACMMKNLFGLGNGREEEE